MLAELSNARVYLALGNTDMRKAINGLSILVEQGLDLDPFTGHLFVFCNRKRTIAKILYWDTNGFCLWQKRLEKQYFKWPESTQQVREIGFRQLRWLLDGLEIQQPAAHNKLHYTAVY